MNLPIKKSRPITIDSHELRWLVTEKQWGGDADIFIQGNGGRLSLSVDSVSGFEGFFWLPKEDGADTGAITPNWIRDVVQRAIKKGWEPEGNTSYIYDLKSNKLS